MEVGCGAGIGRTGTTLACMAVLDGHPVAKAAARVKDTYHPDAVETESQRKWIGWFAGHVEGLLPAWSPHDSRPPAPWFSLFINYTSLLYHEARNVRFLIKARHFGEGKFASLVSLPTNREKAWRAMAEVRRSAGTTGATSGAVRAFEGRFHVSLDRLGDLFEHEGWRHSKIGGNAWALIAKSVIELREALDARDPVAVSRLLDAIPKMSHNTGWVGDKLRCLNAWRGVKA